VVRVPGYRCIGLGSIPGATRLMGLERGPLSLVSTIEELLERNSSGSGRENRDFGYRGSVTPLYPQKLALYSGLKPRS
jgi:hypothetical protein